MKLSKAFKTFVEQAKQGDEYWIENTKLDFSQALEQRRRAAGMSYAAIAQALGTSKAYISKVFRGDANLTIESMVKLARSTGGKVRIQVVSEKTDAVAWVCKIEQRQTRLHGAISTPAGTTAAGQFNNGNGDARAA